MTQLLFKAGSTVNKVPQVSGIASTFPQSSVSQLSHTLHVGAPSYPSSSPLALGLLPQEQEPWVASTASPTSATKGSRLSKCSSNKAWTLKTMPDYGGAWGSGKAPQLPVPSQLVLSIGFPGPDSIHQVVTQARKGLLVEGSLVTTWPTGQWGAKGHGQGYLLSLNCAHP